MRTCARDLLTSHRDALNQLTAALLEQETVTGDQVRALAWAFTSTRSPTESGRRRSSSRIPSSSGRASYRSRCD